MEEAKQLVEFVLRVTDAKRQLDLRSDADTLLEGASPQMAAVVRRLVPYLTLAEEGPIGPALTWWD
jgi:hypothetical protein